MNASKATSSGGGARPRVSVSSASSALARQSASASPEAAPPKPVVKLKQSSWGSRDQVSKEITTGAGTTVTSPAIDESFSFAANRSMWLKRGKFTDDEDDASSFNFKSKSHIFHKPNGY